MVLCHSEQREESVCKNECNQILHCVQDDMRFNTKSRKAIEGFYSLRLPSSGAWRNTHPDRS